MTILSLDPGSSTGWAALQVPEILGRRVDNHIIILASGCIDTGRTRANKLTYLETELRKVLEAHEPDYAFLEQLYTYPIKRNVVKDGRVRQIQCNKQLQRYAVYWEIVNKTVEDWGVKCHYIDTRRLAKKRVAIMNAKNFVNKKHMTSHEAESIILGLYVIKNFRLMGIEI